MAVAAIAVLAMCSCKWALVPIAWLYELSHPSPSCSDAFLPNDGRAYHCVDADGGYGGGPGHWACSNEGSST